MTIFFTCNRVGLVMFRDGTWPDRNILLTHSKWEADPTLTRVLFDPTREDFFWPEMQKIEKFVIFMGKFPNPNPN